MIESMRRSHLARWLPPVGLAALIFFLSAQPDLGTGLGSWDLVLRKLAHMAEFGLLFLLVLRALRWPRARRAVALAALATVAYAVSDELHQTTVAGRVGSPVDVLIDTLGVAVAWAAWRWWQNRARRRRAMRQPAAAAG